MEQYGFARLHAREGGRNLRGGVAKRGTMYRAPTNAGKRRGRMRACGKAEDRRHHHQCGAEQGSIQGLVEKERASNDNCPQGQAKTGRSMAKRGERKKK